MRAKRTRGLDARSERRYSAGMSGRGEGDSEKPPVDPTWAGRPVNGELCAEAAAAHEPPQSDPRSNRRLSARIDVTWSVDCETEDTFLYASITNISEMGIFVRTNEPLAVGTRLTLRFAPLHRSDPFVLDGIVQWVNALRPLQDNPNPGMGVRFAKLTPEDRERIVEVVRTIAYLRENPSN